MPAPGGKLLEFGVCSPWRDESGECQVVGLLSGGPGNSQQGGVGLARISYPDGEILDFEETSAVPTGRPCWLPGDRPRILFAAGDGQLYRCDFDESEEGVNEDIGFPAPTGSRRISRIDCRHLEVAKTTLWVMDPNLPEDARFGGLVVAVIRRLPGPGRPARSPRDEIWWIRLNDATNAVIDAGPLFDTPSSAGGAFLRSPIVGTAADGDVTLAFFSTDTPRSGEWDLRWTRLVFDGSGRPHAAEPARRLASSCSTDLPPDFAMDGRSLRYLRALPGGGCHPERAILPVPRANQQGDVARDAVLPPVLVDRGVELELACTIDSSPDDKATLSVIR